MSIEAAVFIVGAWIALAIYGGMCAIATAIRNRHMDVNVKLPPIELTNKIMERDRGDGL